jgi:hypothetical protein
MFLKSSGGYLVWLMIIFLGSAGSIIGILREKSVKRTLLSASMLFIEICIFIYFIMSVLMFLKS